MESVWRLGNTSTLWIALKIIEVIVESSLEIPKEIKNKTANLPKNSSIKYLHEGNEIIT